MRTRLVMAAWLALALPAATLCAETGGDAAPAAAGKGDAAVPEAKPDADKAAKPDKGKAAKAEKGKKAKPAKEVFGAVKAPAALKARAIGFYSKGCLAGAARLADDGPAWQAMRLSRNRHWGHPELVALLERFALEVQKEDGWPGLLMGDIAQPRGGPMLSGHASHQIGLDADIWLTPMPDRRFTAKEREEVSATTMLGSDQLTVDPKVWTPAHVKIIKRAASYAKVERVLVHPAIKKALCEAADTDRKWLSKVRPYWGHHYHFHVRIGCPKGSAGCKPQPAPANDDGCGKELVDWFKLLAVPPKPQPKPEKPAKPKPPMTVDQLPAECKSVLAADDNKEPVTFAGEAAPVAAATAAQQ